MILLTKIVYLKIFKILKFQINENLEFLKYYDQCKTIDERNFVEDVAFGNITLRSNIDILKRIKKAILKE